MRRLLAVLVALVVVLAVGVAPAVAHGGDDDRSGSGSGDRRDDDDRDDRDDDRDGHDDDDDDDRGRNRRRNRNRNRGGREEGAGGTTAPPAGPPASSASVQVNDRAFAPTTVHVAVGATVTWNNVSRDHTVTADDRSFDSGVFDAGQEFTHTFDTAGAVDYLCLIHPEMTGTVVVGDAPATADERSSGATPSSGTASSGARSGSGAPPLRKASLPPPQAAASADTVSVDVADFSFAPDSLTVAPGTTVRWTLTGAAPHTVTAASFDSGTLMAGDTFEHTFDDVGTVEYRCVLHPEMTGTVAVVTGASTTGQGSGGADDTAAATAGGTVAASALANTGFGTAAALAALLVLSGGMAAVVVSRRRRQADPGV